MKVLRLSALPTGRLYLQEIFLALTSLRGWVILRTTERPEGLSGWKFSMTPSVMEPATSQLLAQCHKKLRYLVPPCIYVYVCLCVCVCVCVYACKVIVTRRYIPRYCKLFNLTDQFLLNRAVVKKPGYSAFSLYTAQRNSNLHTEPIRKTPSSFAPRLRLWSIC